MTPNIPETYREAMNVGNGWGEAIASKLDAEMENKTWNIVPIPKNKTIIDTKSVFKEKVNGQKVKTSCLVVRGFMQSNSMAWWQQIFYECGTNTYNV